MKLKDAVDARYLRYYKVKAALTDDTVISVTDPMKQVKQILDEVSKSNKYEPPHLELEIQARLDVLEASIFKIEKGDSV